MALLLSIESATSACSVALLDGAHVIADGTKSWARTCRAAGAYDRGAAQCRARKEYPCRLQARQFHRGEGGPSGRALGFGRTSEVGGYKAVSAFAPIGAPAQVPLGQKALSGPPGTERTAWRKRDDVDLIKDGACVLALLVDQVEANQFPAEQLKPELLEEVCKRRHRPLASPPDELRPQVLFHLNLHG